MQMKLSKRELIAVSALLVTILLLGIFKFIIMPQRAKLNVLETTRVEKLAELNKLKADAASNGELYVELLSREQEVNEKADKFFREVNQEDIILLIQQFSTQSGLNIPNITFPENRIEQVQLPLDEAAKKDAVEGTEAVETPPATEGDAPVLNEEGEEVPTVDLVVHSADLEYAGAYQSVIDFLKFVSSYDKKILIKDIKVVKNEDSSLTGNIVLDFYSIENILGTEDNIFEWEPNLDSIEGDPFAQFGDYIKQKQAEAQKLKAEEDAKNKANASKPEEKADSKKEPVGNKPIATVTPKPIDGDKGSGTSGSTSGGTSSGINGGSGNTGGNSGSGSVEPEKKPVSLNKTLVNFESLDNIFFIGNNKDILGTLGLNKDKKVEGNSSLSLKYDFVEKRQHNMANISFNNKAVIQTQPEGISLAIHPVQKNVGSVGIIIRDREGDEHKLKLTDDLNWDGWKTVSVDLPIEINYPAIVERIYVETFEFSEKLTGDMLLDDLKMIYDK